MLLDFLIMNSTTAEEPAPKAPSYPIAPCFVEMKLAELFLVTPIFMN